MDCKYRIGNPAGDPKLLAMPFTPQEFEDLFVAYNAAIWPGQLIAYPAGIAIVWLVVISKPWSGRTVAAILAVSWALIGVVYHTVYFARINPAAYGFGLLFGVQAVLFAVYGVIRADVRIRAGREGWRWIAAALALYAVVLYPLIGWAATGDLGAVPHFGVAPCPTVILTIAVLLVTEAPLRLALIPFIWAAIGTTAAIQLDIPQDFGLAAAGAMLAAFVISRGDRQKASPA